MLQIKIVWSDIHSWQQKEFSLTNIMVLETILLQTLQSIHGNGPIAYRIIPNKRAGRGDKVGGAFIMCTKMLICISRSHSAARRH